MGGGRIPVSGKNTGLVLCARHHRGLDSGHKHRFQKLSFRIAYCNRHFFPHAFRQEKTLACFIRTKQSWPPNKSASLSLLDLRIVLAHQPRKRPTKITDSIKKNVEPPSHHSAWRDDQSRRNPVAPSQFPQGKRTE